LLVAPVRIWTTVGWETEGLNHHKPWISTIWRAYPDRQIQTMRTQDVLLLLLLLLLLLVLFRMFESV
jgi:hypothetical protein